MDNRSIKYGTAAFYLGLMILAYLYGSGRTSGFETLALFIWHIAASVANWLQGFNEAIGANG